MKNAFIILFTILLCAFCSAPRKEADQRTDKEDFLIAYNVMVPDSSESGNYDVFVMDMDGSNQKNLTEHPDVAWTYLAVNDRITFISDRDTCYRCFFLYEMDGLGRNFERVSDIQLRDSWMGSRKNGEELVVNPHPTVDTLLYLINRAGEILDKVDTGLPTASDPAFSPDGNQIAFRGGTSKSRIEHGYQEEIYVVNADGSNRRKLTSYPVSDTTRRKYSYMAGPPRWHPTEDFISYHSFQNGKYSLYGVSTDGTRQWKLTDLDLSEGWHDWSPDGKWLTMEVFDNEQSQFNIGLLNWTTKAFDILTDSSCKYQQAPVFVQRPKE